MNFQLPHHPLFSSVHHITHFKVKMSGKRPKKRSYALVDNSDPDSVELRPKRSAPTRCDRQLNHDPGHHGDILPSIPPSYSEDQSQYAFDPAATYPPAPHLDPALFLSYQNKDRQQPPTEEHSYPDPFYVEGYDHGQRLKDLTELLDLADCAPSYPQTSPSEGYDHQQTSYEDGQNPNQQSSQFVGGAGSHPQQDYRAVAPDSHLPPVSQPSQSSPIIMSEATKRRKSRLDAVSGVIVPSKLAPGEKPKNLQGQARATTPILFFCPLCEGGFARKDHMCSHFPACVDRNGNPNGLRWDHGLPSLKRGPRASYQLNKGKKGEGAKLWEEAWRSSWRGQQRSRSQSPWGRFE